MAISRDSNIVRSYSSLVPLAAMFPFGSLSNWLSVCRRAKGSLSSPYFLNTYPEKNFYRFWRKELHECLKQTCSDFSYSSMKPGRGIRLNFPLFVKWWRLQEVMTLCTLMPGCCYFSFMLLLWYNTSLFLGRKELRVLLSFILCYKCSDAHRKVNKCK